MLSPIGDLRSGVDNRGGRGRSAIAGASLRILIGQSAIAGTSLRTQVVIQEVVGIIGSMPTSRVLVMGPGHYGGGQDSAGPSGGPSGGAPIGGYPGGAPGFHGSAADTHGIGNNQCGSSFYGPA